METKLLITLDVASISQSFEVLVPDFLKIKELIPLFVKNRGRTLRKYVSVVGNRIFVFLRGKYAAGFQQHAGRVPDQKRRSFHSVVRGGTA